MTALKSLTGIASAGELTFTPNTGTGELAVKVENEKIELTEATVIKVWNDNNDAAGKRAETKVTVQLLANNEPLEGYSYELPYTGDDENVTYTGEGNNWTLTVGKLPKYVNGDLQSYSWIETIEDGSDYVMTDISTEMVDGVATTTITNKLNLTIFF